MLLVDYLKSEIELFAKRLDLAVDMAFISHCPIDFDLVTEVWDKIEEYVEDYPEEFENEFGLSVDDLEDFDIEDYLWSVEL